MESKKSRPNAAVEKEGQLPEKVVIGLLPPDRPPRYWARYYNSEEQAEEAEVQPVLLDRVGAETFWRLIRE